jgi:hypothetical protein
MAMGGMGEEGIKARRSAIVDVFPAGNGFLRGSPIKKAWQGRWE